MTMNSPNTTIVISDDSLTMGERSAKVTITFSEPVFSWPLDAVDRVNTGKLSEFLPVPTTKPDMERKVWSATFEPDANVDGGTNNRISLDLGRVTLGIRGAGGTGVGRATSQDFSVDTKRPTLKSSSIAFAPYESGSTLEAGKTATLTFTFSEAVKGFDASDVNLFPGSGTLGELRSIDGGITWSATLTAPKGDTILGTNSPTVNLSGLTDLAGNAGDGRSQSTAISYAVDTDRPVLNSATVKGDQLVLGYLEETALKAVDEDAAKDAFEVFFTSPHDPTIDATPSVSYPVKSLTMDATKKTVTLTLERPATADQTVTVSYTIPDTRTYAIQDLAGHAAASFKDRPVSNNTSDNIPPVINSATVTGDQLVLHYTARKELDAGNKAAIDAFTVHVNGDLNAVTDVQVNATDKTVTLTLTHPVTGGETVTVAYADPSSGNDPAAVQEVDGDDAASFSAMGVGNVPDTTPPVLSGATVTGDQLVLRYTETNLLDAIHKADNGALAVRVNEVDNAVTDVQVNATDKTVTLTLTRPVASGDTVTVAYTDPSSGNDLAAVQDATGNDAASFPARQVDNRTPPPPPSPHPRVSDTDKDGLPNAVEDQAPGLPGPDGAAPVAGDGNGDGVQDSEQLAVGSISVVLSPTGASKPGDAPTTFVTLVDDSQGGKTNSESNAQITSLEQKDAPGQLPPGMEMPIGQVCFETALVATGSSSSSSETFSLYVDPALGVNGHWAQDGSGVWANLASAPYGGKMVTEGGRLRLDFQITDGGAFDADGKVDASITASGAPAHMPLSIAGQASDEGHDGFWF
ncbi:SwmB domain-containing protein [Verminephrobacter aporrectodeae]|uniref:SwmB domain-containing protein n=1 Tax=Verminephrobacter aporrectodeae TaxID=1110389 RepID=UPI002242C917|nr:SwmB domain-containing protein [Verminephrobacter aporrectodeae]MCW8203369.1 hypothetical protein [Verminephrobacter aporrectodeae subsp. tuberculatae]